MTYSEQRFRARPARRTFASLVVVAASLWATVAAASSADDLTTRASQLSDSAFSLLNSTNSGGDKGGPMLAPVADLTSDAQTLATSLQKGDRSQASHAMAALLNDEKSIDAAAAKTPANFDVAQWKSLKNQIDALEKDLPPVAGPAGPSVPAAASAPPAATADSRPPQSDMPKVAILSRVFSGARVHVKGFLEGVDLKSAGIYEGDREVKDIELSHTPSSQRVNFDFTIEQPPPDESIRVYDKAGRSDQAMVITDVPVRASSGPGHSEMIDLGGGTAEESESVASREAPPEPIPHPPDNTAEIPPQVEEGSSPPRRLPGGVGRLTNVQINVIGVMASMTASNSYEVVGQISGGGVRRAGVYINGRLVKPIPITAGAFSSFDVTYPMLPGSSASIRAYGAGVDYVESTIDTANGGLGGNDLNAGMSGGVTVYSNGYPVSPYGANPYPYGQYPYPPPNPYAYPYGYPPPNVNPYARPNPYGYPNTYPPPKNSWWQRIF